MESAWLVLLAMLIGVVVGIVLSAAIGAALRTSQRALDLMSADVPDGVGDVLLALASAGVVLDPSNAVVLHSPGASVMGLVKERQLVHPELVAMVDAARRGEDTLEEDLALSRGPFGDESLHVRARAARLGVRYVLVLVEDVTEARRLEDVRRDFVANISHELKTPIGAISLLSEALVSASDDPDQVARFASRLTTEAERLGNLTREIIDLSRLQAADGLSSPQLIEIDRVITSAIEQNHVAADAKRIEVAKGGSKKARIYGDEAMLVVAVHNLVANAIQYSPDGSRVGVGVRTDDELVEIAVTDQGIGLDEVDLDRVFERF
jgi:two-component system, OmpR family, sensor histidine kinase SenX3